MACHFAHEQLRLSWWDVNELQINCEEHAGTELKRMCFSHLRKYGLSVNDFHCIAEQSATQNESVTAQYWHSVCTK